MKSEADLVTLPAHALAARDELRIVGYELVRYATDHARREASKYRHPAADYEYAIHKIEFVDRNDGQIYISRHCHYCSEQSIPGWARFYADQERPAGLALLKLVLNPVGAIISIFALPYVLTLLGMAGINEYMKKRGQDARKRYLPRLLEMPRFLPRYEPY